MLTTNTNCPNCGAPIDIHAEKCAYCDTPYVYISKKRQDDLTSFGTSLAEATAALSAFARCFVMSSNEMREILGCKPFKVKGEEK